MFYFMFLQRDMIKLKFVAALRSGKYKQTEGVFYDPETKCYCASGVLGKVLGFSDSQLGNGGVQDSNIAKDAGVTWMTVDNIICSNDMGSSFDDIANEIMTGELEWVYRD